MPFDSSKFVMVNRQNRPVTVYDRNKRQVRVAPISWVGQHNQWDKSATYVLTDPYFASDIGQQGPLYTMARPEAEALMGEWFPAEDALVAAAPGTVDSLATPVGESVQTHAAKARAPGVGAAPVAAPAATAVAAADDGTVPDDGESVELLTQAELDAMKMPDVRAYAANWDIKGSSKQAILDQLVEGEYVAPPEAE